ncbi:MAG TPA: methyltransferase domain-containing protein [Candidatus Saccharimonadales bacterium]|nr:methyltransferase domain-containing protein [Candidatus Saccharimonadales bacterium]
MHEIKNSRGIKNFNQVASQYDKSRPSYPESLLDNLMEFSDLAPGDEVLELGCGSGQLTGQLLKRGLSVTAIEPGRNLFKIADTRFQDNDLARLINADFESYDFDRVNYKAIFAASSYHWIRPEVSWKKSAALLCPGGTLALLQYFGLEEDSTKLDLLLQLEAIRRYAPQIAKNWPTYYSLQEIQDYAQLHKDISEIWSWLGSYELRFKGINKLFGPTWLDYETSVKEQSAKQIIQLLKTISAYAVLADKQRSELEQGFIDIEKQLKRPMRSSLICIAAASKRL